MQLLELQHLQYWYRTRTCLNVNRIASCLRCSRTSIRSTIDCRLKRSLKLSNDSLFLTFDTDHYRLEFDGTGGKFLPLSESIREFLKILPLALREKKEKQNKHFFAIGLPGSLYLVPPFVSSVFLFVLRNSQTGPVLSC